MNNYSNPGIVVELTAPSAVTAGDVVQVGQIVGIVVANAASGDPMQVLRKGVVTGVPKETGTAWTEGQLVYYLSATNDFSTAAAVAGDLLVGYAAAAASSGATVGDVILDGTARADV